MQKAEKQSEHYNKMNLVVPFSLTLLPTAYCLLPTAYCLPLRSRLTKARAIFSRNQKRLDHVGAAVVAIKLVELFQPEIITLKAFIGRFVRVALQVAKILLQDKRRVPFALRERLTLSHTPQHLRSRSPCYRLSLRPQIPRPLLSFRLPRARHQRLHPADLRIPPATMPAGIAD